VEALHRLLGGDRGVSAQGVLPLQSHMFACARECSMSASARERMHVSLCPRAHACQQAGGLRVRGCRRRAGLLEAGDLLCEELFVQEFL